MAAKAYVCDGAKIECQLCIKPEGELKVTSNEIKIQDKKFANTKDKEKMNLVFQGNCKKSPYQSSPCQSVMMVGEWQGVADALIQDAPALLEDSTIMCNYGGAPIKITDHLQKNEPTSLEPIMAPVVMPAEDPKIVNIDWKEDDKDPEIKAWVEATTLNIMPGESIEFDVPEVQNMSNTALNMNNNSGDVSEKENGKLIECFYVNKLNQRIEYLTDETKVRLVIKSKNFEGEKINIDLEDDAKNFLYLGNLIDNNVIKGYVVNNSEEFIDLEIYYTTTKFLKNQEHGKSI